MNFNIVLTLDQLNLVLAALSKLPFEAVSETIGVVRQQGIEQMQAAEAAKTATAEELVVHEVQ
jgi:hypothetical protein